MDHRAGDVDEHVAVRRGDRRDRRRRRRRRERRDGRRGGRSAGERKPRFGRRGRRADEPADAGDDDDDAQCRHDQPGERRTRPARRAIVSPNRWRGSGRGGSSAFIDDLRVRRVRNAHGQQRRKSGALRVAGAGPANSSEQALGELLAVCRGARVAAGPSAPGCRRTAGGRRRPSSRRSSSDVKRGVVVVVRRETDSGLGRDDPSAL